MKQLIFLLTLLFITTDLLFSQGTEVVVQEKLVNAGFENIRVVKENGDYTISFENNIYRYNVRALATALDTISTYTEPNADIHLVQLKYGVPQLLTSVSADEWLTFRSDTMISPLIESSLEVSYKLDDSWKSIKHEKAVNRNIAKFDFVFYPQFYLTNLTFEKIYEVQFNIAPAVEVTFWKGSLLTAQVILPIYNDSQIYGKAGDKIRPGFLVLSQDFRLPGPVFGKFSLGNFNYNRYGFDLTLAYPFKNTRWHIGLNAGFTGLSSFTDSGMELGELNTLSFSLNTGYFLPRFDLRFDLQMGRYLYGDYGGRFDLTRMFGETAIGFYASYTSLNLGESGEPNAGFHISIPFPPGKRWKHRRFRANVPRYFDWEYNGATDFVYSRYYEVRPNENRSEHFMNPAYIKSELLKNRHY